MITRNRSTKLIGMVIAMVAAAAIWSAWGAGRAQAVIAIIVPGDPFGLAFGQAARLTVLNSGSERGFIINWKFLDSEGRSLAQSEERVMVPPGQMRSFDLDGDTLDRMRDSFGRIQMRAVVRAIGDPNVLIATIEVFDKATGKTTVFIGNPDT